jgi:hypothetical protein
MTTYQGQNQDLPATRRDGRPVRFPNRVPGLHRLEAPAIAAVVMLAATGALAAYAIGACLQQRSLLHRAVTSPWTVTIGEVRADAGRAHAINRVGTVLVVLTGIAFIAWFFQAYRNVAPLGRPRRYAVGWAIGWWFVPFACFVAPLLVARDVNDSLEDERSREWSRTRWLLNVWWAAWLLTLLLGASASNKGDAIRTAEDAFTANGLYVARNIVALVAAVLAISVVARITRRTRTVTEPAA